jgi:hypothetical protein
MYQYDDPTCATSLPAPAAPGTPGWFTDGNPSAGEQATILRSDFTNMLMLELLNVVEAAGITPSKTTYNQVLAAIKALVSPGRYLGTQVIAASGTVHPGIYNGVTAANWRVRGAGGGGSGSGCASTTSTTVSFGTPGLSSAYAEFWTPAVPTVVTVGAAGVAGAAGAAGSSGGNSLWGSVLTLQGGNAGSPQGPVVPPFLAIAAFSALVSGSLTPLVAIPGSPGQPSQSVSISVIMGGSGGDNPLGRGGLPTQNGVGQNASGFGAGGGAASSAASTAARAGGNGTPGVWLVDEYA